MVRLLVAVLGADAGYRIATVLGQAVASQPYPGLSAGVGDSGAVAFGLVVGVAVAVLVLAGSRRWERDPHAVPPALLWGVALVAGAVALQVVGTLLAVAGRFGSSRWVGLVAAAVVVAVVVLGGRRAARAPR